MKLSKAFPKHSSIDIGTGSELDILRTIRVKKSLTPEELSRFAVEEHNERILKEKLQKEIEDEIKEEEEQYLIEKNGL